MSDKPDFRQTVADIDQRLMTIDIKKMRADMQAENRRFVVQAVATAAALLAAGAALAWIIDPGLPHQFGRPKAASGRSVPITGNDAVSRPGSIAMGGRQA
jgi:hypothetical protein